MTARAISLTDRVSAPVRHVDDTWSMPAHDLRAFLNAFESLGYDTGDLLTRAGIPAADGNDPDARVPCEYLGRIVSSAQQLRFTPNLAMELARKTPLGAYPLIDYLRAAADSADRQC